MFPDIGFGDGWAHHIPDLPAIGDDLPHPTTGEVIRITRITMISDYFVLTGANSFLLSKGMPATSTSWMVRPYYVSEEEGEIYARDITYSEGIGS